MEPAEQVRHQMGEYYHPEDEKRGNYRLREVIERLKDEDNRQNHRLQDLEDAMSVLRADIQGLWRSYTKLEVALVGHDGKNGIRGTMMDHYATVQTRIDGLESTIQRMDTTLNAIKDELSKLIATLTALMKVAGSIAGVAGFVIMIMEIARHI